MQLIMYYEKAFKEDNLKLWLHTYKILSTSKTTGLIELIPDAISIDGLKKKQDFPGSLRAWYEKSFGFKEDGTAEDNEIFEQALECYVSSMAAYGVVTYLLAIKDR
jgi:phosphatidylinositol kinase/protein kinase (PI-3  family)